MGNGLYIQQFSNSQLGGDNCELGPALVHVYAFIAICSSFSIPVHFSNSDRFRNTPLALHSLMRSAPSLAIP